MKDQGDYKPRRLEKFVVAKRHAKRQAQFARTRTEAIKRRFDRATAQLKRS